PRLSPNRSAGLCRHERRPSMKRASTASPRHQADDDADDQRARNRAEWIAPCHAFELGCEGLGVLLGRGGKVGAHICHAAGGAPNLRGKRLARAANSFCRLIARLGRETRNRVLQARYVLAKLTQATAIRLLGFSGTGGGGRLMR